MDTSKIYPPQNQLDTTTTIGFALFNLPVYLWVVGLEQLITELAVNFLII